MKKSLSIFTLIGLLLGVAFGLLLPSYTSAIKFIGDFYINFLKYMIVPVVFTSISISIFNSRKLKDKIVIKTVIVFALMFMATFLLSSLIVTLINPSNGFVFENVETDKTPTVITLASLLKNLVPSNLEQLKSVAKGSYLFMVIILSVLVGYVSILLNKTGEKIMHVLEVIKNFLYKVLEYFMYITPFASLALISNTVAQYGKILVDVGFRYILTAYICSIAAVLIVMVLPVLLICHMSPKTFIKKVYKIWVITVSTCSSGATLPYTIKVCKDEFNIPDRITDVVVPLGTTIHMCGGAVSFALLGLFCSKLFNVPATLSQYLLMLVSATLINMAAPGIPGGGVVIGATYLQLLGIPLDFIGFYSGIYKLLDMVYTSLNVTDDIASNVIINYLTNKENE